MSNIHFTGMMQLITKSVNLKEMQHQYCESWNVFVTSFRFSSPLVMVLWEISASYNFDFSFQHSLPMRRQSSFYCFYLFSFIVLFILFPFLCFKRNQLFTHWLLIESCTGLGVDLILFSVFQIFLVAGLKKRKDISVDWSGDFYFLYRLFAAYIYVD